jgi:hypothetical protein
MFANRSHASRSMSDGGTTGLGTANSSFIYSSMFYFTYAFTNHVRELLVIERDEDFRSRLPGVNPHNCLFDAQRRLDDFTDFQIGPSEEEPQN